MPRFTSRLSCFLFAILAAVFPVLAQNSGVSEQFLYSFPDATSAPMWSFLQASDGNFYATSANGIYRFIPTRPGFSAPAQPLVTLHAAAQSAADPGFYFGMIEGTDGNFYGYEHRSQDIDGTSQNVGQVFKLTPSGEFSVLYKFCSASNCTDGDDPNGQMIQGSDGNFYGATLFGGTSKCPACGNGSLFRLSPTGQLTILHTFCSLPNCTDGNDFSSVPVQASDGNFYGSTDMDGAYGGGTLFQYKPSGEFTVIDSLCGGSFYQCTGVIDWPYSRMVEGAPGTIFQFAGSGSIYNFAISGNSLNTTGSICGDSYACANQPLPVPSSFLILASDGNLYAAGGGGAYMQGLIFNQYGDAVYSFCAKSGCPDGAAPGFVLQGNDGALYGSVSAGGAHGFGGIFRIQPGASEASHFPPPVNVTASNYNILAGQSVTLDWNVSNAISTTMRQCSSWLNGKPYGKAAPTGSLKFTPPSVGTWIPSLTCGGIETGYATITVTNKPVVTQTSLTTSSTSVVAGATVTLTALASKTGGVTAVPRGDVTFKSGTRVLGNANLDPTGSASLTLTTNGVPAGRYPVVAIYTGDPGDSPSGSAPLIVTVQ